MLWEYFTNGTEDTATGRRIGCEVETDFVDAATGAPISTTVSAAILGARNGRPVGCIQKLELGRQKIELAIAPCGSFEQLLELTQRSLDWLYLVAERYGARAHFGPEIHFAGNLLDVSTDPRDQTFIQLDGQAALEELCRCSSVQFTVDVSVEDAIDVINALSKARLHELDYASNDRHWLAYIAQAKAGYRADRYAGPEVFYNLEDYATELLRHDVVMHQGRTVHLNPREVPDLDIDLFLRSIWWHYRLRRYADTLTVEIRPLARRSDNCIEMYWRKHLAQILGL